MYVMNELLPEYRSFEFEFLSYSNHLVLCTCAITMYAVVAPVRQESGYVGPMYFDFK